MTGNADLARAESLLSLGRPSQAETMIVSILADDPGNAGALRMLTRALHAQGRHNDALVTANRAIAAEPDHEQGHRLASIVLVSLRQPDEAARAAREAVRLAPHIWQTHYVLGMALRAAHPEIARRQKGSRSNGSPYGVEARAAAAEAVRLAPWESHAHNLLGLCLDDLGQRKEAEEAYGEALRLDATNASAINNLARTKLQDGRLGAASQLISSGLATDPQGSALRRNYDVVLLRLIRRLYLALLVLGLLLFVLAATAAPYFPRACIAAGLILVYGGATYLVTRRLPRGAHLWARGLLKRIDTRQQLVVIAFVLLSAGVLITGFAPAGVAIVAGGAIVRLLELIGLGFIVLRVVSKRKPR